MQFLGYNLTNHYIYFLDSSFNFNIFRPKVSGIHPQRIV